MKPDAIQIGRLYRLCHGGIGTSLVRVVKAADWQGKIHVREIDGLTREWRVDPFRLSEIEPARRDTNASDSP